MRIKVRGREETHDTRWFGTIVVAVRPRKAAVCVSPGFVGRQLRSVSQLWFGLGVGCKRERVCSRDGVMLCVSIIRDGWFLRHAEKKCAEGQSCQTCGGMNPLCERDDATFRCKLLV